MIARWPVFILFLFYFKLWTAVRVMYRWIQPCLRIFILAYRWLTSATYKEIMYSHLITLLAIWKLQISLYRILLLIFFAMNIYIQTFCEKVGTEFLQVHLQCHGFFWIRLVSMHQEPMTSSSSTNIQPFFSPLCLDDKLILFLNNNTLRWTITNRLKLPSGTTTVSRYFYTQVEPVLHQSYAVLCYRLIFDKIFSKTTLWRIIP